jgi:probable rRNA maturation factor
VSIEVCNESGVALDESLIASVAAHVLQAMRVNPAAELSVLAVSSQVMSELHERWMDEPGPTDVMAFPMDELAEDSRRPDAPEMGPALLGDVVLCPAFARDQARQAGHGLADELHLLTVHGVLHLLGYDHGEPEQEREMFTLQNRLLAQWRRAREQADAREAQRRHDARLLGTVGLADDPRAGSSIDTDDPRAGSGIDTDDPRAGSSIDTDDPRAGSSIDTDDPRAGSRINEDG